MSLNLADAKAALARSERREDPNYEEVDPEPSDPSYINHEDRRSTRLLEPASDTQLDLNHIPDPLLECGCGECPDHVDPLGPNSMFKVYAANICENPQPMTLEKARKVYLSYKRAEMNRDGHTSDLEYVRGLYGNIMDAERQLMDEMENPSTIFLSLRQSPIREDAGRREWVSPLRLCEKLHSPWKRVYDALRDGTSEFQQWEYVTVTSHTASAATPHKHILWYVEDPDDELSLEVGKTAVRRYVDANPLASMEYHQVEDRESDAAVIEHEISRGCDRVDQSNYIDVLDQRDGEPFAPNSEALIYMMSQLSSWVLAHVWDGSSDIHRDSPLVDGAVIEWASYHRTWTSSKGFPYSADG
jgi:hypothetical protein